MKSHEALIRFERHRITEGQLGSTMRQGRNGAFSFRRGKDNYFLVVSDEGGWEHVSVTVNGGRKRTPTWAQMCWVKEQFWDDDEMVVQFHPVASEYVSFHPNCLHLWKPVDQDFPTPDPYMVGPDGPEVFKVQRPLASNSPDAGMLIYNKSRAIEFLIPKGQSEDLRAMVGDNEKIYVRAEVGAAPHKFWLINPEIVPDEEW